MAIVDDYFSMLGAELRGERYNKAAHNRALRARLEGRSRESVEYKHRNISAILQRAGWQIVEGYKPLPHVQDTLRDFVLERLSQERRLLELADRVSKSLPSVDEIVARADMSRQIAAPEAVVREKPDEEYSEKIVRSRITDYSQRDHANRRLGELGERFALEIERVRLRVGKREDLAKQVIWASKEIGDGLGYDIQSFDLDGAPRHIEVKATNLGRSHPFIVTRNEVRASERLSSSYWIYRVIHLARDTKYFARPGPVEKTWWLEPRTYLARP